MNYLNNNNFVKNFLFIKSIGIPVVPHEMVQKQFKMIKERNSFGWWNHGRQGHDQSIDSFFLKVLVSS